MTKLLDRFGNPYSDSYCTPEWLTAILPMVDTDPCSNPRSTVRARRSYSLEKKLDGKILPWNGSVFLNWPYSDPMPWVEKMLNEMAAGRCTEVIILCKLDSSTEWWHRATNFVLESSTDFSRPELWTFDKRIAFAEPPQLVAERVKKYVELGKPGGEKSSTNFASTIIHHRGQSEILNLDHVATRWVKP